VTKLKSSVVSSESLATIRLRLYAAKMQWWGCSQEEEWGDAAKRRNGAMQILRTIEKQEIQGSAWRRASEMLLLSR
jgi:hypothetical protein